MKPRTLLLNLTLALAYAAIYMWCYVEFLNEHFEYNYFPLTHRGTAFLGFALVTTILPIGCLRGIRAISSVIAVLIYLLLYAPIVLTFALGSDLPVLEIALVQLTFCAGMSMIFLADLVVVDAPLSLDAGVNLFPVVLVATVAATVYVFFVYRGNLSFAAFGDVYTQRSANESLGASLLMRYVSTWLTTVLVPICFAYGLLTKRPHYLLVAVATCVILYMAAANKIIILFPAAYLAIYLIARNRTAWLYPMFLGSLSIAIVLAVKVAGTGTVAFFGSSILLQRTVANGGMVTRLYHEFFSVHPQTAYSHVSGLDKITQPYPYGALGVGQVVGQYYWAPDMNANANFWATDGLAAMGLMGVLFASVICSLMLAAMNSVTRRYDTLFVLLCCIPFVSTLLNQSMFSSFWSGGAFFLMLFFLFNKRSAIPTAELDQGVV
jgi:hypothetical protein